MAPMNSTNPNPTELTGALPLRTAGVRVDEDGQAQQTALGLGGVVATVERRVVKQQLPVKTDQLGTFVNTVGVRRLRTRINVTGCSRSREHRLHETTAYINMHVHTGVVNSRFSQCYAVKKFYRY